MENAKKAPLKLKLTLARETLRSLDATDISALEEVVGGTGCACTVSVARTAPPVPPPEPLP